MRGVLIFTAFLGLLWALVMGVEEVRDMGSDNGQYYWNPLAFTIITGVLEVLWSSMS
jgi:hypothetical protein